MPGEAERKRRAFFDLLLSGHEGYLCIARINRQEPRDSSDHFNETFFKYPDDFESALIHITRYVGSHDMYFCPQLFGEPTRQKSHVVQTPVVWSDLDSCHPENLLLEPTCVVLSSQDRYQAYWRLKEGIEPQQTEELAKRIAYFHQYEGADTSGWDITQLLRIPITYNFKYSPAEPTRVVHVKAAKSYNYWDFNEYPPTEVVSGGEKTPLPDELPEKSAHEILAENRMLLNPRALELFTNTPDEDWSRALWELELSLFESDLTQEEVFLVCREAACNKYRRDGKPDDFLWREVQRAKGQVEARNSPVAVVETSFDEQPDLLTHEERQWVQNNPSIAEEYVEWASKLGDAAWQFHQAGAFVVLSSLLTSVVRLPTKFGTIIPNLWFMILADTTLTRKSTAMDMAIDLVAEIDSDAVLATDGSIEGLLTSLQMRPSRTSIFLRDEFSGLLEMITKRDYYSGMLETLTKLYDGRYQKRVLRKETIEVKDPILILFAGGIRDRILSQLTTEHVLSGFVPRFLYVTAESDVTKVKPMGPPTEESVGKRAELLERFRRMYNHYNAKERTTTEQGKKLELPKTWDAELTEEAWVRYNKMEQTLVGSALASPLRETLTPTFDRLAKSGLKLALILAASRKEEDKLLVEEDDIVRAFSYIEQWRHYTLYVISNIGRSSNERSIEKVLGAIKQNPGILRSALMRYYHLTARDADTLFNTMRQRGLIRMARTTSGGEQYFAVDNK